MGLSVMTILFVIISIIYTVLSVIFGGFVVMVGTQPIGIVCAINIEQF